jgi:hypothetical protein
MLSGRGNLKQLWNALIARLVYWITPKPPVVLPAPIPESPLKPGKCECGHLRCSHIGGKGKCTLAWPPSEKWLNGSICSCQVFIPKKDNDNREEEPETPSPEELERLYQK